jgi:hypothetical protein
VSKRLDHQRADQTVRRPCRRCVELERDAAVDAALARFFGSLRKTGEKTADELTGVKRPLGEAGVAVGRIGERGVRPEEVT